MSSENDCPKFWMVWNVGGRAPSYKHATKQAAQEEAKRLCDRNPGELFVVLAAVDCFRATVMPAARLPIVKRELDPDDIPF